MPYFVRTDTGETIFNSEIARHVAEIFRNGGSDQWYRLSVAELLPKRFKELSPHL